MLDRRVHRHRQLTGAVLAFAAIVATAAPVHGARQSPGAAAVDAAAAEAVLAWNATAGDSLLAACDLGGYAPQEARILAMAHIAVHDALQAIDRRSTPYAVRLPAAPAASAEAAVASAVRGVLVPVLRQMSFFLPVADCIDKGVAKVEVDYAAAVAGIDDGAAKSSGLALGRNAADAVLALRADDGYDTQLVDPAYVEGTKPGEYGYTDGTPFAFAPHLGSDLTPFVLRRSRQFRPGPPHRLTSRAYARDVREIQRLGGDDVITPSARSADQTQIALFWLESSPIQWNRIARTVAAARGLDAWQSARLLGLLNVALIDGYIGTFEAKYHYRLWRPVTAIRAAGTDGNRATTPDPTWTPLVAVPPIPDYDSGHAVEGGAAAQVMSRFFGSDRAKFAVCSHTLPAGQRCSDAEPTLRTYTRFSQAARENAVSRIYVGFHFRQAVEVGTRHGRHIGQWTVQKAMRPTS
jgi:hypothetical protein